MWWRIWPHFGLLRIEGRESVGISLRQQRGKIPGERKGPLSIMTVLLAFNYVVVAAAPIKVLPRCKHAPLSFSCTRSQYMHAD